jgi:hypothetical protein
MNQRYNVWCRVEVYDPVQDEYEDLDPDICEYKVFAGNSIEEVAEFILENQAGDESGVLLELEDALDRQGLCPPSNNR